MTPWLQRLRQVRFPERNVLLALLLIFSGVLAFLKIADEVTEGEVQHWDDRILLAVRHADDPAVPIGPKWLQVVGRDLTALGGVAVITLVTCAVLGYLGFCRKWRSAVLVFVSVAGGWLVSAALKGIFNRERPSLVPKLVEVTTSSFPSGHSFQAAVTYLTLGVMLARTTQDRGLKMFFLGMAGLLMVLIGLSRIYLGVHYPTDVLAGWSAGTAWALLCAVVARWLQRRGKVESPSPAPEAERDELPG